MKFYYLLTVVLVGALSVFSAFAAQRESKDDKASTSNANSPRFAELVRADFFAGMQGDRARFERAMQLCETTLAKNPEDAEAMVWHGSGLLIRSTQAGQVKDVKPETLFQKGLDEMERAVVLAPDSPSVLLPRGATLLSVSSAPISTELSKQLLRQGVDDYEKVLRLQASYFATLPLHARGELLSGLADGWHRLGDEARARDYHQRIVRECAGSAYASDSEMWLNHRVSTDSHATCQGCHVK